MQDVFILSGARTPIGDFGGAFKDLLPNELALFPERSVPPRSLSCLYFFNSSV